MTNQITDKDIEIRNEYQLGEDLKRLEKSEAWINVIQKGYIDKVVNEAVQDIIHSDERIRIVALEKLQAVAYFNDSLRILRNIAESAAESIEG